MNNNEHQQTYEVKPLTKEEKNQIAKIMESHGYKIDDNYIEVEE